MDKHAGSFKIEKFTAEPVSEHQNYHKFYICNLIVSMYSLW